MTENRGRKSLYAEPMRMTAVMLDAASIAKAKELGEGNLSAGLRKAVAEYRSPRIPGPKK